MAASKATALVRILLIVKENLEVSCQVSVGIPLQLLIIPVSRISHIGRESFLGFVQVPAQIRF